MCFLLHVIQGSKRVVAVARCKQGVARQAGKGCAESILTQAVRNPPAIQIQTTVPWGLTFIRFI